jgi:CheY-like chemotaxis protein
MVGPLDSRSTPVVGGRQPHRLHVVEPGSGLPQRRPITVLYVEDDADDVFLLGRHLDQLASFQVEYAHVPSLAAARSMMARHRFDVVLCDFWLGCETTIPLIDELKMSIVPSPVVLVSSLENDDIELIGRRAGAAGFVAKADLSAAALDRIFNTLLPPEAAERPRAPSAGGVAAWLKALLASLDRVHATSTLALGDADTDEAARALIAEIVSNSGDIRDDIMDKLAGLERATRQGSSSLRFDAVPYVADAVRVLEQRAAPGARVVFQVPSLPILIEASPHLFGDLIQGFFAEAVEHVAAGVSVLVSPFVSEGHLEVDVTADLTQAARAASDAEPEEAEKTQAAAEARRFLVETLARACGGTADFARPDHPDVMVGRLRIPLRAAFD